MKKAGLKETGEIARLLSEIGRKEGLGLITPPSPVKTGSPDGYGSEEEMLGSEQPKPQGK